METSANGGRFETTKPLLRGNQLTELMEEARRIEEQLQPAQSPGETFAKAAITDRAAHTRETKRIQETIATQAPQPYAEGDLDAAIARRKHLEGEIQKGMPSDVEMSRNPVGAVDKHTEWDRTQSGNVAEWKNICLRLHAGGNLDGIKGDGLDVANVERLRPLETSQDLNVDVAQIMRQVFSMPVQPNTVALNDQELDVLRQEDPELFGRLVSLDANQRSLLKTALNEIIEHDKGAAPEKINFATQKSETLREMARARGLPADGDRKVLISILKAHQKETHG